MTYFDLKRWLVVAFLVLSVLSLCHGILCEKIELLHFNIPILVFLFVQLMRALFDGTLLGAVDSLFWLAMYLTFLYWVRYYSGSFQVYTLFKSVLIFYSVYLLFVVLQYIFVVLRPIDWDIMTLAVGFDNVRFLNQLQVFIAGTLFYFFALNKRPCLMVALGAITIALLVNSAARGAFLAIALELTFLILVFFVKHQRMLLARIVFYSANCILLGFILNFLFFELVIDKLFNEVNSQRVALLRGGSSNRLDMWRYTWNAFNEKLLFGNGGLSFPDIIPDGMPRFGHPHNLILQVLVEYGLFGAVLLSLAVLPNVSQVFQSLNSYNARSSLTFLVSAIVGVMAVSMVSGGTVMPMSQFLILIGFIYILHQQGFSRGFNCWFVTIKFSRTSDRAVFVVLLLVIILLFAFLSYTSYVSVMKNGVFLMDVGPRYWWIGRYF